MTGPAGAAAVAVAPASVGMPAVDDRPAPSAGGRTGAQLLVGFPPRPVASSWPATEDAREQVLGRCLAAPFALDNPGSQQTRRIGLVTVVNWLQAQPGDTWQRRWLASGAQTRTDWRDLVAEWTQPRHGRPAGAGTSALHLAPGLLVLICADVIRPDLGWLLSCPPARRNLATEMARTRDVAGFAQLTHLSQGTGVSVQVAQQALVTIAAIMAAKGGLVDDVSGRRLRGVAGHHLPRAACRGGRSPAQRVVLPAAAGPGRVGRSGSERCGSSPAADSPLVSS